MSDGDFTFTEESLPVWAFDDIEIVYSSESEVIVLRKFSDCKMYAGYNKFGRRVVYARVTDNGTQSICHPSMPVFSKMFSQK